MSKMQSHTKMANKTDKMRVIHSNFTKSPILALINYLVSLLLLLHYKGAHIVSSGFVVLIVRAVTLRESFALPATTECRRFSKVFNIHRVYYLWITLFNLLI